jgi:radical SAM protein with 4Fe4S-binding SPASM domain
MSELDRVSNLARYGLEELKFLRSVEDVRILGAKVAYKWPRKPPAFDSPPWSPPSMEIEPTNLCNLRCVTCPGARTRYPKGYMDVDLFQRIVSEASEIGVKRIHLFLRGEPTLHPRIFEMIAFIKSKGLAVHLTSNGTTLSPERSAELLRTGLNSADQLTISFLGHAKESHEATMVGVDHDRVVRNVLGLMRLRKQLRVNGPVVETILNPTPATRHETEEFLRFWQGKVDHARIGGISLSFQEYKRERADSVVRTSPCTQVYERMPVTWDGRVPQCVTDFDGDWIVGDLRSDSIMDVWNGERMQTIRRVHQERQFEKMPLCLHCDM